MNDAPATRRTGRRVLPAVEFGTVALDLLIVAAVLAAGAVVVGLLQSAGVGNASSVFLLAVVGVAVLRGTIPALATAVGAFLAYDFFFIEPTFTFTVRDPEEWLNLVLLLVVGSVVGRLAGRERERAETAIQGRREATADGKAIFGQAPCLLQEASELEPAKLLVHLVDSSHVARDSDAAATEKGYRVAGRTIKGRR